MNLVRSKALLFVASKGAVLLSFIFLAGCSSLFGSSAGKAREPSKLQEFKASLSPQIRWHEDLGDADGNALQPAVTGDAVYAANAKGELYRLDSATGKQRWRIKSGFDISGGVGAGEGLVLVGGNKGDVALGITTSGNSKNMLEAFKIAKLIGIKRIALSGGDGGKIKDEADISIIVASKDTPRIQESHATIGHVLCDLIERALMK